MRYRLMATFGGASFEAGIGPTDGDIVLFAACPPPEDLGFEPATGHWRRQLPIAQVQAVWESRPIGVFRGERCMVLDELGDRLHIGYLGHDGHRAEQLGYWQVDRGVYELIASRAEVTEISEERPEYPRRGAGAGTASHQDRSPGPMRAGQVAGRAGHLPEADVPGYTAEPPGYFESPGPASHGQHELAPSADYQASFAGTAGYGWPEDGDTGQYAVAAGFAHPPATSPAPVRRPDYQGRQEQRPSIALPPTAEPPLPLEAAALAAASASRRPRQQSRQQPAPEAAPEAGAPAVQRRPATAQPGAAPGEVPAPPKIAPDATRADAADRVAEVPVAAPPVALTQVTMPAAAMTAAPVMAAAPAMAGAPVMAPAAAPGPEVKAAQALAPTGLPTRPGLLRPDARPAAEPERADVAVAAPGPTASPSGPTAEPGHGAGGEAATPARPAARQRSSARRRLATERLFAELAAMTALGVDSYAIGEEVEGALCLVQTESGFEVFHSSDGNRHELQFFRTEEAACFYLFGVLAADAVRNGSLAPTGRAPRGIQASP